MTSGNQQGLKPGVLKVSVLGSRRHCTALKEKLGKQPPDTQHGNRNLKSPWSTQRGVYLLNPKYVPERQHSWRDPSGSTKELADVISLSHPLI